MKLSISLVALALGALFIQSAHAQRESGGRLAPLAIEVRFDSVGQGVDEKALKAVLGVVSHGLALTDISVVTSTPFGREGEKLYCIEFANRELMAEYAEAISKFVRKGNSAVRREATSMRPVLNCRENTVIDPRI